MTRHRKFDCVAQLVSAGISRDDAEALRRISMTLNRWHEMECGVDNAGGDTVAIFRDEETDKPYILNSRTMRRSPVADYEGGAKKRLAAIMKKYPALSAYIQGDPRGASLYILRPGDVPEGQDADAYYNRGLAVYR